MSENNVPQQRPPGIFKRITKKIADIEFKIISITPLLLFLVIFVNLFSGAFFGTFNSTKRKGFNVGITGVAKKPLDDDYPELFPKNSTFTAPLQAMFGASYFGGLVFGPTISPVIISFIGFKFTLMGSTIVGLVGQAISIFSAYYFMLCGGRFIIGLAVGVTIVVGTEYSGSLAKVYLPRFKGFVGTMFLVGVSTNLLLANVSVFFSKVIFTWRWMVAIGLIPNLALFFLSIIMPESPLWRTGKQEKTSLSVPVQLKRLFFDCKNIGRMILCFILVISFLFGGVIPMINYLPYTLGLAGIDDFYIRAVASISVAIANIITALGTSLFVNLVGRKLLLGFGYVMMFMSTMSLALVIYFVPAPNSGYIAIGLAITFLVGNNGGINSIIFFIFNELFDPKITVVSSALMFTLFNMMEFFIAFVYLPLQTSLTLPGVLLLFSCNTCITGIFLMLFLPETKGKREKKVKPEIETEMQMELEEKKDDPHIQEIQNEVDEENVFEGEVVVETSGGDGVAEIIAPQEDNPRLSSEEIALPPDVVQMSNEEIGTVE
jgi:MFS transporter, SP family, galactose:H+ symporter